MAVEATNEDRLTHERRRAAETSQRQRQRQPMVGAVFLERSAEQAEVSYKRMVTDQKAGRPSRKVGASATPERA
jgi:hypothetical protein